MISALGENWIGDRDECGLKARRKSYADCTARDGVEAYRYHPDNLCYQDRTDREPAEPCQLSECAWEASEE
jgi:hypothetical protein